MSLFDYECKKCGAVFEHITSADNMATLKCRVSDCKGRAKRIISVSGQFCANEDSPWIRSVLEVVDKEGGEHCQRFLKDPTRTNYKNWMKKEGVRHFEPGERPTLPTPVDTDRITRRCFENHQKRNAIEIRG